MPILKCESIVRYEKDGGRPVACGQSAAQYKVFRRREDAPEQTHGFSSSLAAWYEARGEMSCSAVLCDRHARTARRQGKAVLYS